jgi:putative endonuclease
VGRDEIDVVALDGRVLVVVEVRTRAPGSLADPLETITPAKAARLRRAALRYLAEHDAEELRIDVAAVRGTEVELVENALDFSDR